MANDKDFVVNGPVIVGKDTKVTVGSIAAGAVDLSTGNYFTDSPSGDYTYTFTNPGAVQAFQIEATGGSAAVASTFSTTLYTGTGATQTITNGLDLSSDGGLVWMKKRSGALGNIAHGLYDTGRGINQLLSSDRYGAEVTSADSLTAFNSTGFTLGADATYGRVNYSGIAYASWTFKKQAKFFDVVTWTGNAVSGREIPHNLGSVPGMIIVKQRTGSNNWMVYHRGANGGTNAENYNLYLNLTNANEANAMWADTAPTDTHFTVSGGAAVNGANNTYVAYLFAHDTDASSMIKCGTFSGQPTSVNLGWQPQWLLCKRTDSTSNWVLLDNKRVTGGSEDYLYANTDGVEQTSFDLVDFTSTGFDVLSGLAGTQVYMAIRSASAPAITWPTSIEWAGGIAPAAPANAETDVFTFTTDDTGTSYTGVKSIDNAS